MQGRIDLGQFFLFRSVLAQFIATRNQARANGIGGKRLIAHNAFLATAPVNGQHGVEAAVAPGNRQDL